MLQELSINFMQENIYMEIKVTDYPNSFLKVTLDKDESIITEKGSFIY